jgi:nicotinate-nucleotide--dimethylbenzimidazole phosphoribosyltransferase
MHLGEGTGAVALFPLLDLSAAVYHKMSTFEQIRVEAYEELE